MIQEEAVVVADASVVLKWELDDEDGIQQAAALRDNYFVWGTVKIIPPQLLPYEVCNGLITAIKRKRISSDQAVQAMRDFIDLGIEFKEIEPSKLFEVSLKYGLAAYDAAYLALAEEEKCDLWTGDKAFYTAMRSISPYVKWIGDYAVSL